MNNNSRSVNSALNISVAITSQLLSLFISFVTRTIFIKLLGLEYLGINGLYSNLMSFLSLAELGLGTAMLYTLYKPVFEDDKVLIASLLNYFRRIYRLIALVVFLLGLVLVPFLNYIVNTEAPIDYLELYFLLFLSNAALSYLFVPAKLKSPKADGIACPEFALYNG